MPGREEQESNREERNDTGERNTEREREIMHVRLGVRDWKK